MATLLIKLDPLECERRILIPGDRFLGFLKQDFTTDRLILLSEGGKDLPTKMIGLSFSDALRFHELLEVHEFFDFLGATDEGNLQVLLDSRGDPKNALIRLGVLNLDGLFGSKPIPEGTYIKLTLRVPKLGLFTVEPLPPGIPTAEARTAWFDTLDQAFDQAMEYEGYPRNNFITLSLAYRFGGPAVYREPGASFLEYLRSERRIGLVDLAGRRLIWKRGTQAEDIQFPELQENYGEGSRAAPVRPKTAKKKNSMARLDEFLNDYEFAFETEEIKALFIDAAYRNLDFQEVWDRYFKTASQWKVYPEAAAELMDILQDFMEPALRGYNPQLDPYGDLRTKLVNLYADHIEYIRKLDALGPKRQDLPVQDFTELSQLIGQLLQVLISLNAPPVEENREKAPEMDEFFQMLPQIELVIKDLQKRIQTTIKKRMGRR